MNTLQNQNNNLQDSANSIENEESESSESSDEPEDEGEEEPTEQDIANKRIREKISKGEFKKLKAQKYCDYDMSILKLPDFEYLYETIGMIRSTYDNLVKLAEKMGEFNYN